MSFNTGYTEAFYTYEERGRGWRVYPSPVALEPPCEPLELTSDTPPLPPGYDDGRNPTMLGRLFKKLGGGKPRVEPEPVKNNDALSYPDNPALFTCEYPLRSFGVSLPKGYDVSVVDAEQMLIMLASTNYPVAFEIIGTSEAIYIQWTCRDTDSVRMVSQLRAYFPELIVTEYRPLDIPLTEGIHIAVTDFGLSEEFIRPLESPTKFAPDPLVGILAAFEYLASGEMGMLQILFQGTVNAWAAIIQELATDGEGGSFFENAPEFPKLAQQKTASPLYGVVVRVIGQGANKERSKQIAHDLAESVVQSSRSPFNSLIPLPNTGYPYDDHIEAVLDRTSYRLGMLLNSSELVNLVHLPSASVATNKLHRQTDKTKAASVELQRGTYTIGVNEHNGVQTEVYLTDEQRLRHMHVIGATGVGKSTFLINLFLQDVEQGNGCALIDPHGDTIDDIIKRIPEHRLNDIILIDPSDTEYPIGFNLFQAKSDIEKIVLSSDLIQTIRERATAWGDSMTSILANAINAFLESKQGGTLVELRKFLIDPAYRSEYLKGVDDSSIQSYWHYDYPKLRKDAISPLLTRLDTFLRPKIVRNMMAQAKGIDFNEVLATNKIVLIKLSQGLIGEDNSYLLGTLFLSKFYQAAQARQLVDKEARKPYYLCIDEFHNMISPSLNPILSGARKYGLGLVLAHQELSQIEDSTIANSIISNPGIRVCFRLGDNDARKLEAGFETFEASDLQSLGIGEAIVRVGGRDKDFNLKTLNLSKEVIKSNLELIQAHTRSSYATPKEEIETYLDSLLRYQTLPKEQTPIIEKKTHVPVVPVLETSKEPSKPIITENANTGDITAAAEHFIETTEKRREIREHVYIQDFVKKIGEQRGFKAEIEAPVGEGGRIDILLSKNEIKVACEISVTNTPEYEVKNLQKCIDGGYKYVVMLCNSEAHLSNIERLAKSTLTDILIQIHYTKPDTFYQYLDILIAKETLPEVRVKGYRVKTTYNPNLKSEEKSKIIKDAILNSALKK